MIIKELLEGMLEINETTYANIGDIFDHIFFQEKKRLYRTNKHDWFNSLKAVKKYFEIKERKYQKKDTNLNHNPTHLLLSNRTSEEITILYRNMKWNNNDNLRTKFLNMRPPYDLENSAMKKIFKLKERISRNKLIYVNNPNKLNPYMIEHFKK